jgi:phage terminase small subunit
MTRPLTAKQTAFAQEYVRNGGRATEAYRAAGYSTSGKPEGVHVAASRMLRNAKVAAKVSELRAQAAAVPIVLDQGDKQVLIDDARIMFENARVAFSDLRRLYNEDGSIKPVHEWDADMAAAVASIESRELFGEGADGKGAIGLVQKIKLWNKDLALERLMRQRGMFEKDNAQHNPNSVLTDDELLAKLKTICERLGVPVPVIRLPRRG